MIKTLTANQNLPNFKELKHLKQKTTKLQLALIIINVIVRFCGGYT